MGKSKSTESSYPQVEGLLKQVVKASSSLNKAADEATKYIEVIEKSLVDAGVGITVWDGTILEEEITWYDDESEKEEPIIRAVLLGFAKIRMGWGFATKDVYRNIVDENIKRENTFLLLHQDREMRILAVPRIPELLKAILEGLEEKKKNITETNAQLKKMGTLSKE